MMLMTRKVKTAIVAVCCVAAFWLASYIYISQVAPTGTIRTLTYLSPPYKVDRIYKSMEGPQSTATLRLLESEDPQVVWITGYRAVMVGKDGVSPMSQEYMCHSNLNVDIKQHRKMFSWNKNAHSRLFTLSQGQLEIQFPEGFGIPVWTDIPFRLTTQVLNLNEKDVQKTVRHKVSLDLLKDTDVKTPMKALFLKSANGMVSLDDNNGYYNVQNPVEKIHGPGCLVGEVAGDGRTLTDKFGRKFAGHWLVEPGKHTYRTLATNWMQLPYDSTIHYIAVHLHPFAESLELRDLTADKTVFKSKVDNSGDKIGIDRVDYYSSTEGAPVFKDHQYELISVYNNTSGENQDAMAVMFLYILDRDYTKPALTRGKS